MIKKCKCKHTAQDKLHGQGNRVFNESIEKDGRRIYKCTVCHRTVSRFMLEV